MRGCESASTWRFLHVFAAALDHRRGAHGARVAAHCTVTSATMILPTPWPSTASNTRAMRIAGKDSWMSAMRMMTASTLPPKYAAARPSTSPMASAMTTLATPTESEMRRP